MHRIICVGNRFHELDMAGPRVYDHLVAAGAPEDIEIVDGGLAGLDLLRFVKGARRVVFVDAVHGFGREGVIVLSGAEAAEHASAMYDHAAGLGYLLRALPSLCSDPEPEVFLVGIEGAPTRAIVAEAAETSLRIATDKNLSEARRSDATCGADG